MANQADFVKDVPKDEHDVAYLTHEYEYHWAMIILHGENYWTSQPNLYPPPQAYFQWVKNYMHANNIQDVLEEVSETKYQKL
ncbi:hypothetical protein EXU57_15805 [Segetibacter sp. 3557_3]|uniref:hypothetical protein n=1 Tax=Segetibacter sp. 3557_3 TaxID=2547429 RepID=UPI0010585AF7|nr:hypothetical protein [Segetibacter sp. 3557_3]TDH23957.1 hypothetical protein EXU57_15805 [Segetibacter sp. 3557_3]